MFFIIKWSSKLIFWKEKKVKKNLLIFDIKNWLWKHDFGIFWRTVINQQIFFDFFSFEYVDS